MTGYLVLRKGEASWARRGRFANILAVDDPISFGRCEVCGDGWWTKAYQLLEWRRMPSTGFSPGETPVCSRALAIRC